jgi:hypothetical protein
MSSFTLGRPRLRFVWEGSSLLEDEDADSLLFPSALWSKLDEFWMIQNSPKRVESPRRVASKNHLWDQLGITFQFVAGVS